MLLDRLDIDAHGPLERVSLGPFSQTLNAIVAASGSGKTALVRFLRDSLTGTTPTREGLSRSSGRVVWAAADGLYHYWLMKAPYRFVRPRLALFGTFNIVEFRGKQSRFLCANLRHHLMHREIRSEGLCSCIRNPEAREELLHFPIFAVFAVKTNKHCVQLAQDAFGRDRPTSVVPLSVSVDIDIASDVTVCRKMREYRRARLERDIMLS